MPHFALRTVRFICSVEGITGIALNVYLILALIKKKMHSSTDKIYMVPLIVGTTQGLLFSITIAALHYAPTFQNGTFIIAVVGPAPYFLPVLVTDVIMMIGLVICTMSWTLIPATGMLQLAALSRKPWSTVKRLLICFSFTIACIIDTTVSATTFFPTPVFSSIMSRIMRELYHMGPDDCVVPYGATWTYTEANNGRGFLMPAVFFINLPYILSYVAFVTLVLKIRSLLLSFGTAMSQKTMRMQRAFYTMQMLQGFLPLAIMFVPFTIFLGGALTGMNMDYRISLILTGFLWICPVVQAAVQISFVRKSTAKSPRPSNTVSKLSSMHL